MKLPVPENPDQINVITGHILLSSWLEFWAVVAHATRKHRAPNLPCWAQRSVAAE
jgi:hypothetical protein